jgi:membrane protease YdiL (CAAX protease family)
VRDAPDAAHAGPPLRTTGLGDRVEHVPPGARRAVFVELTVLWLVTLLLIRGAVAAQSAGLPDWTLAAVPFCFIYAPVLLCKLRGADSYAYRIALPDFSDRAAWREALALAGVVTTITFAPWLPAYHVFQNALNWGIEAWFSGHWELHAADLYARVTPSWHVPKDAWLLVLYHLFFVAIPEEFFYRGYVQTRLNEVFPRRFQLFGTAWGWGLPIASIYFAFGHSLVQFQWWHFATFFPGIAFGWMRERTGSPLAGALFHAACNVAVVCMDTFYGIRPPA